MVPSLGPRRRWGLLILLGSDSVKLEEFLYTRGFREGACSDITIIAFSTRYRLHRLILDRSPFFSSCFNGGPWAESNSSEITLSPETADPNIEKHAFELALARLYGHVDKAEEDNHALALLAAASYLELQDLAESCVTSLLRGLKTSGIADILTFITNSYYGPLTDRLSESAKAMLYRDGWEMSPADWDGISGEVAAQIASYDGFYVPSEYQRYLFVKQLLDWRLGQNYSHQESPTDKTFIKVPEGDSLKFSREGEEGSEDGFSASGDEEDARPLRECLENSIYYIYMTFEQLQGISGDTDFLGRPVVPEHIIRDALWQQMVLRQRVVNAPMDSPELGITKIEYIPQKSARRGKSPAGSPAPRPKSMTPSTSQLELSYMGFGPEKKYFIPIEDSSTTVIGDCPEQTHHTGTPGRTHARGSSMVPNVVTLDDAKESEAVSEETRYSQFPPFRFSAEFRGIRALKEKRRVYSKTVFYAGSYWNIYIQKVKSSKNTQLGVYLHRAKDRDGTGSSGAASSSSDQLIGIVKSDADEGETTLMLDGDNSSGTITSRANISASRSMVPSPPEVSVGALPPYCDHRPMIQTYFKIFSPSRKGKMLSMFSSRPDSFNFSQSWGWKSSSLILDEGVLGADGEQDTRLRFMVVLGE